MKKIYLLTILLLSAAYGWSQSFTVTGPRTFFSTQSSKGTPALPVVQYFNFDKGTLVASTEAWHISLSSTSNSSTIAFNTGVEGQILTDTTFSKVTAAPSANYAATITNGIYPASAAGAFLYNPTNHMIAATAKKVIVVKLTDGRYVKIEMLSLYKNAPIAVQDMTSTAAAAVGYLSADFGYYAFRYLVSAVSSTDLSQQVTKISNLKVPPSSSPSNYQMVNLAIADSTLAAADRWNFRINATAVESNTAGGSVAQLIATAFNDVTTASAITSGSIAWYTYEGTYTHTIAAKPSMTIVFKDTLGRYGKIVIESYYKNAPSVVCAGSGYYTIQYYYNPYGGGESLAGRNGLDLTTNATINQSVSTVLALSASALPVLVTGLANPEEITVTSNNSWAASTTESWITLADATGSGDGSFTISTTANAGAEREGDVDVVYCNGATKTIVVTQAGVVTSILSAIADKIRVYPNPSSERFNIDLGSTRCDEVAVMSMAGKQLLTIAAPSSQLEINAGEWNKGIYFLKVSSSEGVLYKMIEVQ